MPRSAYILALKQATEIQRKSQLRKSSFFSLLTTAFFSVCFFSVFSVPLWFVSGASVRADSPPMLSLRELTIRADVVVLAEPLDMAKPGRFRVCELLKGTTPQPKTEIEIEAIDACLKPRAGPFDWNRMDAALLFLRALPAGRFSLVDSGARLHTRDQAVWWPLPLHKSDNYQLIPEPGVTWDAMLLRVRDDSAEISRLLAARGLADPVRRDSALLEWIERHRHEFAKGTPLIQVDLSEAVRNLDVEPIGPADLDIRGWGELQLRPFAWVLEGAIPADCWRAINLYAELNEGSLPPGAIAAFSSRDTRSLLLEVARDKRQLIGYRLRALRLLGDKTTLTPVGRERAVLLDGLLPLLNDPSPACRGLAAMAIWRMSGQDNPSAERAMNVLVKMYKVEPPGPARNALAEALYDLAGAQRWAVLTGRPNGSLALLCDLGWRNDKLFFWLTYKHELAEIVTKVPTLVLERLDDKGDVEETKKLSLPVSSPPVWSEGWSGGPLYVEFGLVDLKPGSWRLRVIGEASSDKTVWESEPRMVQVAQKGALIQGRPRRSVWDILVRSLTGTPASSDSASAPSPVDKTKRTIVLDGESF